MAIKDDSGESMAGGFSPRPQDGPAPIDVEHMDQLAQLMAGRAPAPTPSAWSSEWIGIAISLLLLFAGGAGLYANQESRFATLDERVRSLEEEVAESRQDLRRIATIEAQAKSDHEDLDRARQELRRHVDTAIARFNALDKELKEHRSGGHPSSVLRELVGIRRELDDFKARIRRLEEK